MSEYTPTISELREAWLSAEFEERDATTSDDDLRAEFDRALAAHDAEMRAGVVAEEPEWEYAVAREEWPRTPVYRRRDLEAAEAFLLNPPLGEKRHGWLLIKQAKAGPWVLVKQEGPGQ
ncbi:MULTISPECIES: hypothetical protein [unclassified Microbacterium]|uniref:hypothetical protein n=1 Tax=unclassified Microbacterium TaxID=2609290 RepID=UPI00109CB285|nr:MULTISPECIES: hypothetical protein [unclassified Microbacterium]